MTFATAIFAPHHSLAYTSCGFAYNSASLLGRAIPSARVTALLCHPIAQTIFGGTGISTCCPSTTPFGLALGPDLP
jgi:hypothetical protein